MLATYLRRNNPAIRVWLPDEEPDRTQHARALAAALSQLALRAQQRSKYGLLIGIINDAPAREHLLSGYLLEAGFIETSLGLQMRRRPGTPTPTDEEEVETEEAEPAEST